MEDSSMVIIVAGGRNPDNVATRLTKKLSIGAGAWTAMTPLPRALIGMASVTLGNKGYLLGR